MASQVEKNEQKWQDYLNTLPKEINPPPFIQEGYMKSRDYWNTYDNEAVIAFENLVLRQK